MQDRHLGQVYGMSGAVSSVYCVRRRIWAITGDVNFDHVGKVVSAMFFHHQITIPPLVTNKYLVGRNYFATMLFYVTHQTFTH